VEAFLVMTHEETRDVLRRRAVDREAIAASMSEKFAADKHFVRAGVFLEAKNYLATEAAMLPAYPARADALRLSSADGHRHLSSRACSRPRPHSGRPTRALEKAAADPGSWSVAQPRHIAVANDDPGKAKRSTSARSPPIRARPKRAPRSTLSIAGSLINTSSKEKRT